MISFYFSFDSTDICIVGDHLVNQGLFVSVRDSDDNEIALIFRSDIKKLHLGQGDFIIDGGDLLDVLSC